MKDKQGNVTAGKKGRGPGVWCRRIGTLLLVVLILACAPIAVPKVFGISEYSVVSGSMEPKISIGSLVYVKYIEPANIKNQDVITFYGSDGEGAVITHRVLSNSSAMGSFITKGDANPEADANPVSYGNYIGKVVLIVPKVGGIAQAMTTLGGRVALVCMLILGLGLRILGAWMDRE